MMSSTPDRVRAALLDLHDRQWDPVARLVRTASGRHSVRESALGALLDLTSGDRHRAALAIRAVLDKQYLEPGLPWSGSFKVFAEEPDPPASGAVEWQHYDPNWRQFVGCVLAYLVERHSTGLPPGLVATIEEAVARCVSGEPQERLPAWYTNPNLMHAWLAAWVGARSGERSIAAEGEARRERTMARFERLGDVDEYNSPTYDGIDLMAAGLWAALPPTPAFRESGRLLAARLGRRLAALYHPELGAICGPYIRAYGLALDRYVSLAGEWLALAGADRERVLPPRLDETTDHVHDLYFAPWLAELSDTVVGQLPIRPVGQGRDHEQCFGPVLAASRLGPDWAFGAESGRVHTFARDQYFPFTAHFTDGDTTTAVGIRLGAATSQVDARLGDRRRATVIATGNGSVELTLVATQTLTSEAGGTRCGRLRFAYSQRPGAIETRDTAQGCETRLSWAEPGVQIEVELA